jgi:hypothetical protein
MVRCEDQILTGGRSIIKAVRKILGKVDGTSPLTIF